MGSADMKQGQTKRKKVSVLEDLTRMGPWKRACRWDYNQRVAEMERGREWIVMVLGSNHACVHPCTFTHISHSIHSYLTFHSRDQMILLSPRTSSGSKSIQISTPSAPSFPTTLALPASPNSHSNRARMLAHSSTLSGMASKSSGGSFFLPDILSKPRQRSPRWTASAVRALPSGVLVSSDPWPPSAHVDPRPPRPAVLQHA